MTKWALVLKDTSEVVQVSNERFEVAPGLRWVQLPEGSDVKPYDHQWDFQRGFTEREIRRHEPEAVQRLRAQANSKKS